ncbi:hypothetical protein E8E14_012649 [Neopestalotiopsis sp. 37M]|nr:hypothetical protein E8E14_012649 [Neopestalotiopsis sp. 37M]
MGQAPEAQPAQQSPVPQYHAESTSTPITSPQPAHVTAEDHPGQKPTTYYASPSQQQQQPNGNYFHNAHATAYSETTPLHLLGPAPAAIDCPYCGRRGLTRVDESDSSMTILAGIGLGVICICLACLPCCLHWFPDHDHHCSHCGRRVAHVPQSSGVAQVLAPPPHQMQQGYQPTPQPQYHGGGGGQQQQQQQQQQTGLQTTEQQKELPQLPPAQAQSHHQGQQQQYQEQQRPSTPPPQYV